MTVNVLMALFLTPSHHLYLPTGLTMPAPTSCTDPLLGAVPSLGLLLCHKPSQDGMPRVALARPVKFRKTEQPLLIGMGDPQPPTPPQTPVSDTQAVQEKVKSRQFGQSAKQPNAPELLPTTFTSASELLKIPHSKTPLAGRVLGSHPLVSTL